MATSPPEPTRQGFIEADGHRIHWEYFGDGDREAVCLLNGLAMHTKAWSSFLPLLQPEFDVLLYDYPGQGESSAPDEPISITRIAAYLTMIMDALGIERIHSMGISYGGFVAIEHARQFHHRLHTLTLSGIILSREELFEMYEALSLRFYRLGPDGFGLYTHYLYEKIFGEPFVAKLARRARADAAALRGALQGQHHSLSAHRGAGRLFGELDDRMPEYRAVPRRRSSCPASRTARSHPGCSGSSAVSCRTSGSSWSPTAGTACTSSSRECSSGT